MEVSVDTVQCTLPRRQQPIETKPVLLVGATVNVQATRRSDNRGCCIAAAVVIGVGVAFAPNSLKAVRLDVS